MFLFGMQTFLYFLLFEMERIKYFQSFKNWSTSPLVHLSTGPPVSAFLLQPECKKGIGDAELVVLFFEDIEIGQSFVSFLDT